MSSRRPDRRRQTPGGAPRRGGAAQAFSTTRELLVNIARVILLAIMVGAVIQAAATLAYYLAHPARLPWPHVNSYVAFVLCVVAAILMLALALNSSYLPDRIFPATRLGALFVVVWAAGAAAIVVGLIGSFQLGAYVAIELLPAVVPFVLMGLVSPGLYRRPVSGRPDADDVGPTPADGERERGRQRRGGRSRR